MAATLIAFTGNGCAVSRASNAPASAASSEGANTRSRGYSRARSTRRTGFACGDRHSHRSAYENSRATGIVGVRLHCEGDLILTANCSTPSDPGLIVSRAVAAVIRNPGRAIVLRVHHPVSPTETATSGTATEGLAHHVGAAGFREVAWQPRMRAASAGARATSKGLSNGTCAGSASN